MKLIETFFIVTFRAEFLRLLPVFFLSSKKLFDNGGFTGDRDYCFLLGLWAALILNSAFVIGYFAGMFDLTETDAVLR